MALLLGLTACGGDGDDEVAQPTSAAPSSTTAPVTRPAQAGDTVSVHYTGTLDDGSQFDSSAGRDPLKFKLGASSVIDGFDAAVDGLTIGDKVTTRIEPANAYGEWDPAGVIDIPRTITTGEISVGAFLTSDTGQTAEVIALTDSTITIDRNHFLAGEALTFEIELVQIEPPAS